MNRRDIVFTAASVECSQAIDWEIVQVTFDSHPEDQEEDDRVTPYLLLSVNFEFGDAVQLEFHDGQESNGDRLRGVDLWRDRVHVVSQDGFQFKIRFDIPEHSFLELREYLRVLLQKDVFHP